MADKQNTRHQPGIASALQNASFLAASRIYYLIIRSVYVLLLVQVLGVELYGYYTYSQNWYVMLTPLAMWGMNELLISEFGRTQDEARERLVGTGMSLRLILGALCATGIVSAALLIEDVPQLQLLMIIYAQGVLARNLSSWFSALFVAQGKSHYWLCISITSVTLEVLLILFLANKGATLVTIALVQSCIWWGVVVAAALVHRWRLNPVSWRWSTEFVKRYLQRGAMIGAATFLMSCMPPGLLILYRQLSGDLQGIGEIALVLQLFLILDHLVLAVSNATLPALNRALAEHKTALGTYSRFVWSYSFLLGGSLSILGASLLPAFIAALPPSKFDEAGLLLAQFSWIIIPLLAIHGLRLILISTSHVRLFLAVMFVGLLAMIALVLTFHMTAGVDKTNALASMGSAFAIIVGMKWAYVRKLTDKQTLTSLMFAPGLLAGCYTVLFSLPEPYRPISSLVAGAILLGTAVVEFKQYRAKRAGA